jgi:hypothetical protein
VTISLYFAWRWCKVLLLKSHIKAFHRAAVDSENDDDLIHELDTVASALHLTSHQGA